MARYLEAAGIHRGPVFRQLRRGDNLTDRRLSDQSVALIVKRRASAAGVPPELLSGHSLRAGYATAAAAAGVEERKIANVGATVCGSARRVCPCLWGPLERVAGPGRRVSEPGHLALIVDRLPEAARSAEGAQILHAARRGPLERVNGPARRLRPPGHLAPIVDRQSVAVPSTKRAQILHAARRGPPERVTGPARRVSEPGPLGPDR
jgi:hypothetical protein